MEEEQLININFLYNIRFVFGFNHDFGPSRRARWLATLYCIFVCVATTFCTYVYFTEGLNYYTFILLVKFSESVSYLLLSIMKKNEYLQKYYKKMRLVDDASAARSHEVLRACLLALALVFLLYTICSNVSFHIYFELEGSSIFRIIFVAILQSILFYARLPVVFVLSLMYCRVRFMRTKLERNEFNCSTLGTHHPRRYTQMYETIMDSFEETDNPMKLLLFICFAMSAPYFSAIFASTLQLARGNGLGPWQTFWVLSDIITAYAPITISAILSDLISEEVQELLGLVVEKRIRSKSEREYAEIQQLFEYMKSRPYHYTVWRVIPFNVRTLLTLLSFSITTIIAILQIKSFNI